MDRLLSRRFFMGSAAASVLAPAAFAAPPDTSLRPVLRGEGHFRKAVPTSSELVAQSRLNGRVAFAVADTRTGNMLEEMSPSVGMPPASVTKAITALYALETLGAGHVFETQLIATGGVLNGEVQGDLVLAGGGDPTLDTNTLAVMAAKLKEAGVRSVKGTFYVYEGSLPVLDGIDPNQPDYVSYNPAVTGVALNFNRVHFEWKRASGGYAVTMDGRSEKYRPAVTMAAMQITDRASPLYTYSDGGARDNWTVAKPALGGGGARWLPVRKPGLYAGDVFVTMAGAQGIRLRGLAMTKTRPVGAVLVAQQSAPLRDIMRDMLQYSTNLTAEMAGLAATQARGQKPGTLKESAAEMNRWAKGALGMSNPALVDHSGLGDDSRVSVQDMVAALIKVSGSGVLKPILKTILMRDAKRKPLSNHPINVVAKTGTLNFVSTLAGYMTGPNGREMAFAIFCADEPRRATITRAQRANPDGGRAWNVNAKRLQQTLIERWGAYHEA